MRLLVGAVLALATTQAVAVTARPVRPVAPRALTCNTPSAVVPVAAVQNSPVFAEAVRRIAATSYGNEPTAFAVEFQRICEGLRLWRSSTLPALQLVDGVAYQGIVDVPLVFAVGRGQVKLLNPTPADSLNPGLDTLAWNTIVVRWKHLALTNARAAIAAACVVDAIREVSRPADACDGRIPLASAVRRPAGWRVSLPGVTIWLGREGAIKSIEPPCRGHAESSAPGQCTNPPTRE